MMGDEIMTSAMLDRLLHHARIFNLNGKSYRVSGKENWSLCFFLKNREKQLPRWPGKILAIYKPESKNRQRKEESGKKNNNAKKTAINNIEAVINEFNAQKTTKMQSVNEDGWYDDAPDECVDLDRPANVSSHDKGYEMRMNAHYERMRKRNNKRNGVREVAAPVEKKEVKADVKPIKPIYFVIMAILYILYKSATMLHLL